MIRKILIVLLTLLLSTSFLLFHNKGNQLIRPYVASYLEHKVGGVQIEIGHLKIDMNHIEFDALLNGLVKLKGEGKLSLLTQDLNLNYTLKSDSLKDSVDINGTVIGSFSDMYIAGEGVIFNSVIDYRLYRKDAVLHGVKVQIENADVASFLRLTLEPAYARGRVDVDVAIPNLEKESLKTNAKVRFHGVTLNNHYLQGELNKRLWHHITANLNFKVCNRYSQLEGFLKSDMATLNLYRAHYDMKRKEFSSDYRLFVSKLSKLTKKRGVELRGTLEVEGRFKSRNSQIELTGRSESLGGKMVFNLHDNRVDAHMNGVEIEKLLTFLGEKPYVTGLLIADVELSDVLQQKGVFSFQTQEAKTVNATLKDAFNLELEKSLPFMLNGKGAVEGEKVIMESKIDADVFHGDSSDITYNLKSNVLKSHYLLHIPKLSKLNRLIGKNLNGELNVKGELNYEKELIVRGESSDLGGNMDFTLNAEKLKIQLNRLSVEKLLDTFSYAKLFKAKLVGSFEYDLVRNRGVLSSHFSETELLNSSLINMIEKIKGKRIESRHYDKTYLNASFQGDMIGIDFKAENRRVLLSIPKGSIDSVNKKIYAYYRVKIDDIVLDGKIKGALSNPEITFNSAKYLQNNMMSVIEETIPSPAVRGFKMGKKNHDTMKNMMFDFFK